MNGIERSLGVWNGKPVIKGKRIIVQTVLSHLGAGDSTAVGEIHLSIELVS